MISKIVVNLVSFFAGIIGGLYLNILNNKLKKQNELKSEIDKFLNELDDKRIYAHNFQGVNSFGHFEISFKLIFNQRIFHNHFNDYEVVANSELIKYLSDLPKKMSRTLRDRLEERKINLYKFSELGHSTVIYHMQTGIIREPHPRKLLISPKVENSDTIFNEAYYPLTEEILLFSDFKNYFSDLHNGLIYIRNIPNWKTILSNDKFTCYKINRGFRKRLQ